MVKRLVFTTLAVLCMFTLSSCYSLYTDEAGGVSFAIRSGNDVSRTDEGTVAVLSEKVSAVIFTTDALPFADSRYLSLYSPSQLNLHTGAFEANYNNYVYVSKVFEYLINGGERGYSVYGIKEGSLGEYPAWTCDFTSQDGKTNGYLYLTVEHARCVIVCVYVYDTAENMHKYDRVINKFTEKFTVTDKTEEV